MIDIRFTLVQYMQILASPGRKLIVITNLEVVVKQMYR